MRGRPLGFLGLTGYVIHAGWHISQGHPEDAIWVCHLSALAVSLGLLFRWPMISAAGTLCLMVGTPLWILYLLGGSPFLMTSPLTHVLGPILGLIAIRKMGLPRRSWVAAIVLFAGIMALTLAFTPRAANVNLAFAPDPIWTWAPTYLPLHLAWVFGFWGMALLGSEMGLRKFWIRRAGNDGAVQPNE